MILLVGIVCGALQLAAAAFAVQDEYDDLATGTAGLQLVWLAIPAAITLRWAYGLRHDTFVTPRVPAAWGVATALQVVAYLALDPGSAIRRLLPAALIVALVFLWAVWSGRRY